LPCLPPLLLAALVRGYQRSLGLPLLAAPQLRLRPRPPSILPRLWASMTRSPPLVACAVTLTLCAVALAVERPHPA
jgi:hypothetical protein